MSFLLNLISSVIYGIMQGITEWLPISSTAHLILMRSFQDTVRIYRRSDGKLLCQQRLEVVPSDLLADNETNTLVMVDADCRKFFWQLEGRSS